MVALPRSTRATLSLRPLPSVWSSRDSGCASLKACGSELAGVRQGWTFHTRGSRCCQERSNAAIPMLGLKLCFKALAAFCRRREQA